MKQILLINSDLATNRGDRAIAEGNIALIRSRFPGARVVGLSQFPDRDRDWFGIDFLEMDFQSLSPLALLRLCRVARRSDLVLWGGGEILKDYTNRAALWYWVLKMTVISWANPELYGLFQGIGPTSAASSKRLIASVVDRCRAFMVRDEESRQKLVAWGADARRIHAASDPAVLPVPDPVGPELLTRLRTELDIDESFLEDFVCIGPRDWFHYRPGGLVPFKYRQKVARLLRRPLAESSADHSRYLGNLTDLVSALTAERGARVLLVPMHMGESDGALCRRLREQSARPDAVRVLDKDILSPAELRSVVARATTMIGFRLHSTIVGVSAGVPSVNVYYVDKGRVFFDQIGQSRYALPIERALAPDFVPSTMELLDRLASSRDEVSRDITQAVSRLRETVASTFRAVLDGAAR